MEKPATTTLTRMIGPLVAAALSIALIGCDSYVDTAAEADDATQRLEGAAAKNASVAWDYGDGPDGPAYWAEQFGACGGRNQSPIDIVTGFVHQTIAPGSVSPRDALRRDDLATVRALGFQPLRFAYAPEATLEVFNNTRTVEAEIATGHSFVKIGGRAYTLLQFHFHVQSEHQIDGQAFPAELHLVHRHASGALAVVGVFIKEGQAHAELAKIWADLPGTTDTRHIEVEGFELDRLLPEDRTLYRYTGSLTTPPCSEGVSWNLMAEPIEMSAAQLQALGETFSDPETFPNGNFRPVQPLYRRIVQRSPR